MGFFGRNSSKKYKSPKELRIYKGQIRYTIYEMVVDGKSHEDIYDTIKSDGGFQSKSRSDALKYISYFNQQMIK